MKIEEAKKELIKNKKYVSGCFDNEHCKQSFNDGIDLALDIIDQTEPYQPKPVVPQFVAEWYEEHKLGLESELLSLCWKIKEIYAEGDFEKWFEKDDNPIQTLINMHQFGYEVKKEKLYRVKLNDHLYFKEFIDSMFPVFVIDDMPGALDDAFIGKEELALKHAREFGGRLEEAKEVTE